MPSIAVVLAARTGPARDAAERVAGALRAAGHEVDVLDARALPADLKLERYRGAVLSAEAPEMVRFVVMHKDALDRLPTLLLSRPRNVDRFIADTAWCPRRVVSLAEARALEEAAAAFARVVGGENNGPAAR